MLQDQLDSIVEARTAFVVTSTDVLLPPELEENYRFVMSAEGEKATFLLYERKEKE